jgi:hypothetical protein
MTALQVERKQKIGATVTAFKSSHRVVGRLSLPLSPAPRSPIFQTPVNG